MRQGQHQLLLLMSVGADHDGCLNDNVLGWMRPAMRMTRISASLCRLTVCARFVNQSEERRAVTSLLVTEQDIIPPSDPAR